MGSAITVKEEVHTFWKKAAMLCGALSLILFLLFWNLKEPFWESIFRFGSFIFFAASVLGFLKVMGGPLEVTLNYTDQLLLVSYLKKGEKIQEEQFERETIEQIENINTDKNILVSFLQPHSSGFKINFNDTDRDLYLFEFSGRPLLFGKQAQEKIVNFLEDIDINTKM